MVSGRCFGKNISNKSGWTSPSCWRSPFSCLALSCCLCCGGNRCRPASPRKPHSAQPPCLALFIISVAALLGWVQYFSLPITYTYAIGQDPVFVGSTVRYAAGPLLLSNICLVVLAALLVQCLDRPGLLRQAAGKMLCILSDCRASWSAWELPGQASRKMRVILAAVVTRCAASETGFFAYKRSPLLQLPHHPIFPRCGRSIRKMLALLSGYARMLYRILRQIQAGDRRLPAMDRGVCSHDPAPGHRI